ncbi:MAG: hypothetical protein V7607_2651 [Solirubrobacteraceae bacterium]
MRLDQGQQIDGTLASWADIESVCRWQTLLLGNGLSINLWPEFRYGSLYDKAKAGSGSFAKTDERLFAALDDTTNFELVLAHLKAAIRIARACGENVREFERRYRSIQASLGSAVRAAHVSRANVPDSTLAEIRAALLSFELVFTTSYDLITYWAMGHRESFEGFCDYFWSNGRNEFDRGNATIWNDVTPVFFLHGALHLIVDGSGTTRKRTRNVHMLLEQFGRQIPGDPDARPLLVTEGSFQDKLVAIEDNEYLRFGLQTLRANGQPLVVFGHSLSAQDRHLIDAINEFPDRPVAVSIVPDRRSRVRSEQAHARAVLETARLYFYDSTTHRLGAKRLRAPRLLGVSGDCLACAEGRAARCCSA